MRNSELPGGRVEYYLLIKRLQTNGYYRMWPHLSASSLLIANCSLLIAYYDGLLSDLRQKWGIWGRKGVKNG